MAVRENKLNSYFRRSEETLFSERRERFGGRRNRLEDYKILLKTLYNVLFSFIYNVPEESYHTVEATHGSTRAELCVIENNEHTQKRERVRKGMDGFKGLSTVVLERRMHTQLISRIFVTHGLSLPLAFLGKFFLIAIRQIYCQYPRKGYRNSPERNEKFNYNFPKKRKKARKLLSSKEIFPALS